MPEIPAAPKKKPGLFGPKPAKEPEGPSFAFLSDEMITLSTRLKVLEERSTNIKKKQQLIEQNMLSHRKKYSEEIGLLKDEIDEIKRTIIEIENRIVLLIKEFRMSAKKEEVDTLKKYIELWEPLKFVTQNQVEKIVRDVLEEEKGK